MTADVVYLASFDGFISKVEYTLSGIIIRITQNQLYASVCTREDREIDIVGKFFGGSVGVVRKIRLVFFIAYSTSSASDNTITIIRTEAESIDIC